MEENKEYCTGQTFQMVFVTTFNRLWQCKICAYQFTQPLTDIGMPVLPPYHPKPIPKRFTVSDEQIRAILQNMPAPAFPPGIPPKLRQVMDEYTEEEAESITQAMHAMHERLRASGKDIVFESMRTHMPPPDNGTHGRTPQ